MDRQHVEPKVQVFAKHTLAAALLEILIGGRDDADVDIANARLADALDGAILQESQQLGLQSSSGRSPISSRKSVPPCAISARPRTIANGARESAPGVTEELRFNQVAWQGSTTDGNKRLRVPRSGLVDLAGQRRFPRAALASDE